MEHHIESCDESKCVSKGRSDLYNVSFTCYGDDGTFYPRMCADGLLPVVVEDEPSVLASAWTYEGFETQFDESTTVPVRYFTCCPPDSDSVISRNDAAAAAAAAAATTTTSTGTNATATRHCSDPIQNDDPEENSIGNACEEEDVRKFPISIKSDARSDLPDAHLCCDSDNIHAATKTFLEESECVPYRNQYYDAGRVEPNQIGGFGFVEPIHCDQDIPGGDFGIPRPLGEAGTIEDVYATQIYQCCKTGTPVPPYVRDSVFWLDVCIPFTLFFLGAVVSAVVIIGLTRPLLRQVKDGSFQRAMLASSRKSKKKRGGSESVYSTYNLYLVYLAGPDLVFCLWTIGYYIVLINNKTLIPDSVSAVSFAMSNANIVASLWLNDVVLYQVLLLLKSTQGAQRVSQPTLRRVNLQGGGVYLVATITFLVTYFFNNFYSSYQIVWLVWVAVVAITPIGYGIYLSCVVKRGGYLRIPITSNAVVERAIRELAIYFFRIVWVFVGVWVPVIALAVVSSFLGQPWAFWAAGMGFPLQAIATTCAILTKSDARKYISDVVTPSCCFRDRGTDKNKDAENGQTTAVTQLTTRCTTLRGDVVSSVVNVTTKDDPNIVEGSDDEETGIHDIDNAPESIKNSPVAGHLEEPTLRDEPVDSETNEVPTVQDLGDFPLYDKASNSKSNEMPAVDDLDALPQNEKCTNLESDETPLSNDLDELPVNDKSTHPESNEVPIVDRSQPFLRDETPNLESNNVPDVTDFDEEIGARIAMTGDISFSRRSLSSSNHSSMPSDHSNRSSIRSHRSTRSSTRSQRSFQS